MRLGVVLLGLFGILGVACSSTSPTRAAGNGDAGADGDTGPCAEPPGDYEEGRDPAAHCVKHVSGTVTSDGAPLAGLTMTVCGRACFGGQTGDDGAFRVRVNTRLPDGRYTLFVHGRPRHASLFLPLPSAPAEDLAFAPIDTPALSVEGGALPPDDGAAANVRVGPIELDVPASTSWQLSFEDATDDVDGRMLRFVRVPPERAPRFAEGAKLVYALAPFEAKPSNRVGLRLHESAGLAPGAAVEILVMDGFDFEGENRSGQSRVEARGHVSDDGARIETDPGEGLSLLTWIAIRPAP